jgi:transcriptional regulator with XRE-family HTH domain
MQGYPFRQEITQGNRMNTDTIGGRIRARRLILRLTQEQLAKRLDIERPRVANWEGDRNRPDYELAMPLANALHTTPGWLWFGEGGVSPEGSGLTEELVIRVKLQKAA